MDLQSLLDRSCAAEAFKVDVSRFLREGAAARIELVRPAPPVKVERLLLHLLEAEPDLTIERVRIQARSGCSDFRGVVQVETPESVLAFEFTWCCRWRAETEGYTDFFGFPDQIRAASEFRWRCFKEWRRTDADPFVDRTQLSAAR
jgi:hypothetical protein